MQFLTIYKNGELYGYKLSVQHLKSRLEKKYLTIKEVPPQHNEIARIIADSNIYTVYE